MFGNRSRNCPICGNKAVITNANAVDYDLLCNYPKRELLLEETVTYSAFKETFKDFQVIDTRAKDKFDLIKSKAMHIPLFEINTTLEGIEKILVSKKILCIAYNRNDARYGAEIFANKGLKSMIASVIYRH